MLFSMPYIDFLTPFKFLNLLISKMFSLTNNTVIFFKNPSLLGLNPIDNSKSF